MAGGMWKKCQAVRILVEFFLLIAGVPVKCLTPDGITWCSCYYFLKHRANIFDCSSKDLVELPLSVPNSTNWILPQDNRIDRIRRSISYLNETKYLNLKGNKIKVLDDTFITTLRKIETLIWFDISDNQLSMMPKTIQNLTTIQKLWLNGNPFHCDCSMTWMIGWSNNFTNSSGKQVVQDYQDTKCATGKMVGIPIFVLSKIEMGCFPSEWTNWQKVGVGIRATVLVIIVIILAVSRNHGFVY